MGSKATLSPDAAPDAIEVFCSYSHRDDALREELEKHLSILQANGVISNWHDHAIPAGKEWESQIDEHLNSARIILLLISPDFLASKYCREVEVHRALERHKAGEAIVIPIMLRDVDWHGSPLSRLQALPKNANPVLNWPNHDQAFKDIAVGIRKIAAELQRQAGTKKNVVPVTQPQSAITPQRSPQKYILAGVIVLALLAGFGYFFFQQRERQQIIAVDWSHARFDSPVFSRCMDVKACLDRKTFAANLVATDWTKVRFDSSKLTDCMAYQPCLDRASWAEKLKSVKDWSKVRRSDPTLLNDCMEYEQCLQAKKPTVKSNGTTSADEDSGQTLSQQLHLNNN